MISPNIYHAVVFNLHPKIKEFLDQLDLSGQIDHDEMDAPHLVSADPIETSIYRCVFIRNGRPEHVVMHTRKKADPIKSWKDEDGYKRKPREKPQDHEQSRKERERRPHRPFESIMEQILRR